jgi:hypothetical protein
MLSEMRSSCRVIELIFFFERFTLAAVLRTDFREKG